MHAGVVGFRVRPGGIEEAVQIYLGSVVPTMRDQKGFRGALVLSNSEIDEGYAIGMWETEDDAAAFESSGLYQEQIAKFGRTFAEPPVRKVYEVSLQM